jgi:hypothetical protein
VGRRPVAQLNRRWLRGVERQRRRKDSDDSTGDEAGSHDRERRLAALPVEFGEREVGVCNAERRAGEALEAMTVEDGLCMQESGRLRADGGITLREVTRLRRLDSGQPDGG